MHRGPLRGEAGPRARRGLPRLRGVLLEQQHVYVPRQKYLLSWPNSARYPRSLPGRGECADNGNDFISIPHDIFCECPDESVDYAVMGEENAMRWWSVSMPTGATSAPGPHYGRSARKTGRGNVLSGDAWVHNSETATSTATKLVAAIGVENTVIVSTGRRAGDEPRAFPGREARRSSSSKQNQRSEYKRHPRDLPSLGPLRRGGHRPASTSTASPIETGRRLLNADAPPSPSTGSFSPAPVG